VIVGRVHGLTAPPAPERRVGLADFIGAIGTAQFEQRLLGYLNDDYGVDHVSIFQYGQRGVERLGAVSLDGTDTANRQTSLYIDGRYWRVDPLVLQAQRDVHDTDGPSVYRLDIGKMPMGDLRDLVYRRGHVRDRVLICGPVAGSILALSILRSEKRGTFSDDELQGLSGVADVVLSVMQKHREIKSESHRLSLALASLDDIEQRCALADERLPRREVEVCARILYGMSTLGISIDLGIGEETVMTYRKRIYQRLSINSHRELLLWYMALWASIEGGKRAG
jgi:DNA-binding CsgD family transcriptional regulator